MCLLVLVRRPFPGISLLVLANRDEDPLRPSLPARLRRLNRAGGYWLGGVDGRSHGTWFGLNDRRLLVAVTNRVSSRDDRASRSRGLLCRDLLECRTVGEAQGRIDGLLAAEVYAGFNVVVVSAEEGFLVEAGDDFRLSPIESQTLCLGNGGNDDLDDPRLAGVRQRLETIERVDEVLELAASHDEDDPARSVCRHDDDRRTVSSAVVALGEPSGRVEVHWSDGPPCTTSFRDLTPLAATLCRDPKDPTDISIKGEEPATGS